MTVARRTAGPAYANLQGRKPRDVGRGGASGTMGISSLAVCVRGSLNAFCGLDRAGWQVWSDDSDGLSGDLLKICSRSCRGDERFGSRSRPAQLIRRFVKLPHRRDHDVSILITI